MTMRLHFLLRAAAALLLLLGPPIAAIAFASACAGDSSPHASR